MKKVLYFDTETTGKDPNVNNIIELAGFIEIDGKIVKEFCFNIRPFDEDISTISEKAIKIHKIDIKTMRSFPDPLDVFAEFTEILDFYKGKQDYFNRYYPAGYHVIFDINFLKSFFLKCGDKTYNKRINNKYIDPLPILNILDLKGIINLPNHQLKTVCEYFDIEIDAHKALSDIKAASQVMTKLDEYLFE